MHLIKWIVMIIRSADFVVSNSDVEKCPSGDLPEYAFIGRSNVGKSSLINMLSGKSIAMTSSMPGKTILINHFMINNEWYLVDLPGYGYAKKSKKEIEKISGIIHSYVLRRRQLICLFVLIDIRLEPQKNDLEFISMLGETGTPFAIIFTKADKLSKSRCTVNVEKYKKVLLEQWETLPPCFITSAEKKTGRDEVLDYIDGINKSLGKRW